jgi:hypothetical protein
LIPDGYDIKKFIRPKISEDELCKFIYDVVKLKPEGFIKFKREGNFTKNEPNYETNRRVKKMIENKKIRVLFFGRLRDVVGTNEIIASDIKDIEDLKKISV